MKKALLLGALALALTGCDNVPHAWSRTDLEEIAARAAADNRPYVAGLESRISDLEREVRELRADRVGDLNSVAKLAQGAADDGRYVGDAVERLDKNDEVFRQQLNWLLVRNGGRPIGTSQ